MLIVREIFGDERLQDIFFLNLFRDFDEIKIKISMFI